MAIDTQMKPQEIRCTAEKIDFQSSQSEVDHFAEQRNEENQYDRVDVL